MDDAKRLHRLGKRSDWITFIEQGRNKNVDVHLVIGIRVDQIDADFIINYHRYAEGPIMWYVTNNKILNWRHPNVGSDGDLCINKAYDPADLVLQRIYQLMCFPYFDDPMHEMSVVKYYGQYTKAPVTHCTDLSTEMNDVASLSPEPGYEDSWESFPPRRPRGMDETQWRSMLIWWGIGSPENGFEMDTWLEAEREVRADHLRQKLSERFGIHTFRHTVVDGEGRHATISNTAYHYWHELGQPEGADYDIWLLAEAEWEVIEGRRRLLEKRSGKPVEWKVAKDWYLECKTPFKGDIDAELMQWF